MGTNVSQLKERLDKLRQQMTKFDQNLEKNFGVLDIAWQRLDKVWEGQAREKFYGDWQKTRQAIKQYLDSAKKQEALLQERIAALEAFEKGGS